MSSLGKLQVDYVTVWAFIIICTGKSIGAAEDNSKHLEPRGDDTLLW